ncbi:hypothetical protein MML48_8g00010237 [Holotrichia oblita]|uniref:Uncharacterized protein n=1 Tax=Holotrichia oblita TaxID=644536 RepID=A0ACB9SM40_HOLOL|nr:hypothetical protein MML48_8g00010237 [Holotrichia oblita]
MTLYFENPVHFTENGTISTNAIWHPNAPLLAVASYSQDKGGFVTIFDELGEPISGITFPNHPLSQVTALAWHPERKILSVGWENGELQTWNENDKEFMYINGPHKAPVTLLEFSEKGSRLISCDSSGSLVGWKVESKDQIVTAFHHDLKECITHLTFRLTVKNLNFDIEGLAKAAVNGDEQALDIFSNWRPKTTARKFRVQEGNDNSCFYVGTQEGTIYYVNQTGACVEVLNTEGIPLSYILYHSIRDILVIMMEGLTVATFTVDSQGQLTEMAKVKLSGRMQSMRSSSGQGLLWAGTNCLAILTGDLTVRIWDIDTNDNYVLPITMKNYVNDNKDKNRQINEMFTCLAFSQTSQTLCAGTNIGRLYFWLKKLTKSIYVENPEDAWELSNINVVSGTIKQLMWGSVNLRLPLLSVNCVTKVYIMKEQSLCTCYSEKIWAMQRSANEVSDMAINDNYIVFTNGRSIAAYEIIWNLTSDNNFEPNSNRIKSSEKQQKISINVVGTFSKDNEGIILYERNILTLFPTGVTMHSLNGSMIASIPILQAEGEPIGMDLCGTYLTIFTIDGFLKVYDLSDRDPKLITNSYNLYDMCSDFGEIIQAKSNNNGTKVGLTIAAANLIPDGKLYIWDIEKDTLLSYDFKKKRKSFDYEDDTLEISDNTGDDTKSIYDKICTNRIPLSIHWDIYDSRLLVCNARKMKIASKSKSLVNLYGASSVDLENEDHVIATMFISPECGIRIHDIKAIASDARLLALCTPHIVILKKLDIVREIMNDFVGLENCSKTTKEAVLEFSYNLSLGNMDTAFKAIKLVQSTGVWNSLARMCVKTKKLDVAGVCLGHMGNARAARALRQAIADPNLPQEAKLAVLAIQLNMLDDAEQLYIQCERYDLLNKLYQSRNKMDEALTIAETKDRIHLRNTEYHYARQLEQDSNYKEAIIHYEKANTHRYDVPRMLLEQPDQLQLYMSKTNDPEMLKWWGQNLESQGDLNAALKAYMQAGDVFSQVRVLCFMNEDARAADLARKSNDKAAFYHMARHYETLGNFEDAVSFFTKANAYSNAVRICKENNMLEELWNIGTVAGNRDKLECARHLEQSEELEKAVILYHRAGMLHKALDLAFNTHQFETLQQIATELDSDSDPALVAKCAEYFVTNSQFDKAVDLLAIGKKYKEAIDVCLTYNVQLNEDLVEKLTPEKDQVDEETRSLVLDKLGETLSSQGNYHLATKKFTQAGDKVWVKAMKALLKSGDTDKIIFFTGISRQREIYIMAANYLQSLDWQNQPDILRHIITFYSKGKSLDLLANFYVACAQVEIDEFQNYDKAFGALTEASRCLSKVTAPKDPNQHHRATEIVQQRLTAVKRFIDIKRLFERGDVQSGMTQCRQLLMTGGKDLEAAVRRGDIYAVMIQTCIKNEIFEVGRQLFNELKQILDPSTNAITYYLSKDVIEALATGLGLTVNDLLPVKFVENESEKEDDVIEEVVE